MPVTSHAPFPCGSPLRDSRIRIHVQVVLGWGQPQHQLLFDGRKLLRLYGQPLATGRDGERHLYMGRRQLQWRGRGLLHLHGALCTPAAVPSSVATRSFASASPSAGPSSTAATSAYATAAATPPATTSSTALATSRVRPLHYPLHARTVRTPQRGGRCRGRQRGPRPQPDA